jgi:hypothetical protein
MTRRQLLRRSAWFGAAVVLTVGGGEIVSHLVGSGHQQMATGPGTLSIVRLSDSHLGFRGAANTDVTGSFSRAIERVNSLDQRLDFVMHSGDLTHLATPAQFDQVKQMMTGLRTGQVHTVPGEHDAIDDAGQKYRSAFGAGSRGDGWYSFDAKGVHVIALVNSLNLKKLSHLGADQLEFVRKDVAGLSGDTPIVVFSHIPLFALYPAWGWGTDDAIMGLQERLADAADSFLRLVEANTRYTRVAQVFQRGPERPQPTVASDHGRRGRHEKRMLVLERLGPDPRHPVDGVLQHSGHRRVVLGSGDHERVTCLQALVQGQRTGRQPLGRFDVPVVDRHGELPHMGEVDRRARAFHQPGDQRGKTAVQRVGTQ